MDVLTDSAPSSSDSEKAEPFLLHDFVKGQARLKTIKREVTIAMLRQSVKGVAAFMGLACCGSVFLVGFFPFHVGSGYGAALRVRRGALAPHHFSIIRGRDNRCYLVPCCDWGIDVDGVVYRYGIPRVPLRDGSIIKYRALEILVHIPEETIPAMDGKKLLSSRVFQYEMPAPL